MPEPLTVHQNKTRAVLRAQPSREEWSANSDACDQGREQAAKIWCVVAREAVHGPDELRTVVARKAPPHGPVGVRCSFRFGIQKTEPGAYFVKDAVDERLCLVVIANVFFNELEE